MVGRGHRIIFDCNHHQSPRSDPVDDIDRLVGEDLLGTPEPHAVGDPVIYIGFDLGLAPLGGGNHDLFSRLYQLPFAGRHSLLAIRTESGKKLLPLILSTHPTEPVLAIGNRDLGHGAADTIVNRGEQNGVAASRAA